MTFKQAEAGDFETAFRFIRELWSYNTYEREEIRQVYEHVLQRPDSFFFFLVDEGVYQGMCHGDYFDTFWMSGATCYISSLYVVPEARGKGYGIKLVDHARALAKARGCRAMILDSGLPRVSAHRFYERYGFEKSCYGFELVGL